MKQSILDSYVSRNVRLIACVLSVLSAFYFMVLLPIKELQDTTDSIKDNHLLHIADSIEKIQVTQEKQGLLLERVMTKMEVVH
jgi:hypothetical protein